MTLLKCIGEQTVPMTEEEEQEHRALQARLALVDRQLLARRIDDAVAEICGRYTRFQIAYEQREAQARAFKATGYVGDVPKRIEEYAAPAGKTPKEATDVILAQADSLRGALDILETLRMRKYEVLRAPSDAAALAAFAALESSIAAIGAALS